MLETRMELLDLMSHGPMLKTNLMSRANLSWRTLGMLLEGLLRCDLARRTVSDDDGRPVYELTDKGRRVLGACIEVHEVLSGSGR